MSELWNKVQPIKIPSTQFTLTGYSRASKNTSFYIPEMKIMLDCGIENEYIPDHIFVTHCHADHSKNIPLNLVQLGNIKNKENTKKINFYVPQQMQNITREFIHVYYVMSKNNPNHKVHNKYNLIGVTENTRMPLIIRNKKYIIDIIKCFHTVPCVGYGFIEVRTKLKDEYKDLTREDIIKLKKTGVDIQQEIEVPLFCYLGDTDERVFVNNVVDKYPVIIIECTFIHPDQLENAKNKKHIHINNIENILMTHTDKMFILYHFSDRYEREEIIEFFNKKNYKNVIIWI